MLSNIENEYPFEKILEIKFFIEERCKINPKIGIICGSGLGSLGEVIIEPTIFDYENIPSFPISTVQGHPGRLILGHIKNVPVICMQGRFHYYEGYSLAKCVMPIKLMKLFGVKYLIASNAAGGLNQNLKIGDIMIINDHVNIMNIAGIGSLIGFNDPRFGTRFFSMVNAYDDDIIEAVKRAVMETGIGETIKEGVYTCTGGPCYETVAEVRALKNLEIDAVGMSTVHEVTAARHCEIKCFAFSLITNICSTDYRIANKTKINADEVIEVGKEKENDLRNFIETIVEVIRNHVDT